MPSFFMVYPNTKWSEAWGSESVFVRDGEITDAIIPKPGRLVIFQINPSWCKSAK